MTNMRTLDAAWAEAEKHFKAVHLDKVGKGRYLAQVNRRSCICERCSFQCERETAVEALTSATEHLLSMPLHEPQG